MPRLSICIAAYNQSDLIEKNLKNLIRYKGEDVEFLISDDCSTEDIGAVAASFEDRRIRYTKTLKNNGHDLNIINAVEHARGQYVMVLRSRDTVFPEKIDSILNILNDNDGIAYCVFSALDENGNKKLTFRDKYYHVGKQAIAAHKKLFVHPSGNIYKKEHLDTESLRGAIKSSFDHKFGFSVHELIRMSLACIGDFYTSSIVAWQYVNSEKQKDTAVNSIGNGGSVYSPKLGYERCACELNYINCYLNTEEKNKKVLYEHVIFSFYKRIVRNFSYINNNREMQAHYNYQKITFSPGAESKKYRQFILSYIRTHDIKNKARLIIALYYYSFLFSCYYPLRDKVVIDLLSKKNRDWLVSLVKRI